MASSIFGTQERNPMIPQGSNTDKIKGLMTMAQMGRNPNQAFQTLLMSNPNYKSVIDFINQNGGDPKTAFYKMAELKGVNPESILSQLR